MGSRTLRWATLGIVVVVVLAAATVTAGVSVAPVRTPLTRPLTTAVLPTSQREIDFQRVRAAGARMVRLAATWYAIAPDGNQRPSGFDASDPNDPRYDWRALDRSVRMAHGRGLAIILNVVRAPLWAQGTGPKTDRGEVRPDPRELRLFAHAAAERYSGRIEGLPRIRYWQVWNEPNLTFFLSPQKVGSRLVAPAWYRNMVNAFAVGVKAVRSDNLVIAGGLAPLGKAAQASLAPLAFMRAMLCVSRAGRATCAARARFDIWAHHPYTTGGPTHKAFNRDDVALGDLPEMRDVLRAAYAAKRVQSPRLPAFWVTEFSWDTKPPDPRGVPLALHARWTSEALYRMWAAGVSLVTWWLIEDQPYQTSPYQSGLYFGGNRAKPALQAFRFPFVALRQPGGRVLVWGRTPDSGARRVSVQQRDGSAWRRVALLVSNRYGIFTTTVRPAGRGPLRAVAQGVPGATGVSLPFSLVAPPDRYVRPFG